MNYNLEGVAKALAAILRADFPEYGWTVTVRPNPNPIREWHPAPTSTSTADVHDKTGAT